MTKQQIETELKKLRNDFEYFCKTVVKIQDRESDRLIPFVFNRVQRYLWSLIKEQLLAGVPIRMIILKARQMGASTFVTALIAWVIFLRTNRNAIIAAHREDGSINLYTKIQLMYRCLPEWLRPMQKINNRGQLFLTDPDPLAPPGLESQITVSVSDDLDLGRTFAIHFFLGSEVAFWKDAETVLTSAGQCFPRIGTRRLAGTFEFLESTAQGSNYFKTLWDDADEMGYTRIFTSWVAYDTYTDFSATREQLCKLERELYNIDDDLYGNEFVEREAILTELVRWYPENDGDSDWLWEESLRRLSWRRHMIRTECKKKLVKFKSEYPTTAHDAFMFSGSSIFDQPRLQHVVQNLIKNPPEYKRYHYDIAEDELVEAQYGDFWLFEPIYPNRTYVIGSDCGLGVKGGDPSAAVLLRCPEMVVVGVYVAVVRPDIFAAFLNLLGTTSGTCKIAVEANDEGGYEVNRRLFYEHRYRNLYMRETVDTTTVKTTRKPGWKTTKYTKPTMMTDMAEAITYGHIQLRHFELVKQLLGYHKREDGQYGCAPPQHDDIADAAMIALQMGLRIHDDKPGRKTTSPPKYSLAWYEQQILDEDRGGRIKPYED